MSRWLVRYGPRMRLTLFLALALAGCRTSPVPVIDGGSVDLSPAAGGDLSRPRDAAVDLAPICRQPSDCRLYSSYCSTDPCMCIPLGSQQPDPVCQGTQQSCFTDPCLQKTADCVAGSCVAQ